MIDPVPSLAWVVGRGGLLGGAIERRLAGRGVRLFAPRPVPWPDADAACATLVESVADFAIASSATPSWTLYWAAGVGTMGSDAADLATESRAFGSLLDAVARSSLDAHRGTIVFASSAGAVYAGSSVDVIDERCPVAPTTAYAHAKLAQEAMLDAIADRFPCRVLVARLSTLYGPGQAVTKPQGLLTHISRCLVRGRPIRIFVPLDTIRDYLAVDDAAALIDDALEALPSGERAMRIVASERSATIGELLAIFKRLSRRPPLIVTSASPTSLVYPRRMRFRSRFRSTGPESKGLVQRSLLVGIGEVLAAERRRYAAGS